MLVGARFLLVETFPPPLGRGKPPWIRTCLRNHPETEIGDQALTIQRVIGKITDILGLKMIEHLAWICYLRLLVSFFSAIVNQHLGNNGINLFFSSPNGNLLYQDGL